MRRMALALAACWGLGMLGGTATGAEKSSLPVTTAVWQPAAQVEGGAAIELVRHRGYYGRGYYGYYRPYQRPYYGAYRPYYSYRPYYNYYQPYYGYGGYYRPYTAGRYYGYPYGRYYW